ncbi:golgin subfamily A member 6-like protein 22 [Prorops nasuta]|uniref:golgin subfamily A member 6-like protein 22 n=1 Tax=Prorops nasuta TaxID=863751 RepID=UPI0034CE1D01
MDRKGRGVEIAFWNVAGVSNKDEDFWERIGRWDVVCLVETWLEEKGWETLKKKMPRGHEWWVQWAKRQEKKGRAKGRIVMGVKKGMKGKRKREEEEEEGIMEIEVKIGREEWRIIGMYVGKGIRSIEDGIRRVVEREQGKKCLIGGDWNARIGEAREEEEGEEGGRSMGRKSKDGVVNAEGTRMMELMGEMGLVVFNGTVRGDSEGEYTYVGHMGRSVIDYVVGDMETREEIREMEVEVRVESDHLPIVVKLDKERKKREERGRKGRVKRGWEREQLERFKEKTERIEREEEEGVEKRWEKLQEEVRKVKEEVKKEKREGAGMRRGWWDEECRAEKRELRKKLRRWLRGSGGKEEYGRGKRMYKEMCEGKKERWREEWYKEVDKARTETEVWEIIRRSRRRGVNRAEEIAMKEWDGLFKEQLGGWGEEKEERVEVERRGRKKKREGGIDEKEVDRQIERLKGGKAAGENGLENEEEGEGKKVEDYRGVTLMDTMAKVYAGVLGERLEKEME